MSMNVWQIDESDYPSTGSLADKVGFFLRYAALAPSAHNTQPWSVQLSGERVDVYRDPTHTLEVGDPTLRETQLGIGAFVENIVIAANHWNYEVKLSNIALTNPPLLRASLKLTQASGAKDALGERLFAAIPQRHTNRGIYRSDTLPEALLSELAAWPDSPAKAFVITDAEARARIAELVAKGTATALSMNAMRRELASLVTRESEAALTGMTVEAMTEDVVGDEAGSLWAGESMDPAAIAASDREGFVSSPAHIVIGTQTDGPAVWLQAGRLMERVLLLATSYGLNHAISASPVEIPTLAPLLRKEIDPSFRPQVLLRIGRPKNEEFTRHSGRRMVSLVYSLPTHS